MACPLVLVLLMTVVIAHYWKHLHHESNIVYEIPQVLGHVSSRL